MYATHALIARARGDAATQFAATRAFVGTCRAASDVLDVTIGSSGALLGCTFLLDALDEASPPPFDIARREVRELGNDIFKRLWQRLEGYAPIARACELNMLGIAHGWAGLLYAVLCWCAASGEPLPSSLPARLDQLQKCSEPVGRGLQWPWSVAPGSNGPAYMPGWCNGSAGYVFLWSEAFRATGDRKYFDLAEGAAWNAWEVVSPNPSLCCGMSGQAYALLRFHRLTGNAIWLRRAYELAEAAAIMALQQRGLERADSPEWRATGLYKGVAGLAVLAADIEHPGDARMPAFERDV